MTWDPIAYTQDGGYYGVWGKAQGNSNYTLMATTMDKSSTSATVSGLLPNTTYEFIIRTFTPAHSSQQNELTSVDSGVVTGTTTPMVETYTVHLPLINKPALFESTTINNAPISERPISAIGEVFYTTTANIGASLPSGGTFYLSSDPNAPVAAAVDDEVAILLNGTELFTHAYGQPGSGVPPALVEVPRSIMEQIAGETVTIEFRDVYGVDVSATTLYLIWSP